MKFIAATASSLALLASLASVQAYDKNDFKGKFVGTDTTGIHGDHGVEMEGKMKLVIVKVTSTEDRDGGTLEGKWHYAGEHDDGETEDVVGVWFEDGNFHMIETTQTGTIDGCLHDQGKDMYASLVLTEPGSGGEDGLVAAGHRLDKK